MSKKWIWILAGFMGLIVTGLVAVQAYWIREAMLVKEQQFMQVITRSLLDISADAQRIDAENWIREEIEVTEIDTFFLTKPLRSTLNNTQLNQLTNSTQTLGISEEYFMFNQRIRANFRSRIRVTAFDSVLVYSDFWQQIQEQYPEATSSRSKDYSLSSGEEAKTDKEKLEKQRVLVERVVNRMTSRPRPLEERIKEGNIEDLINSHLELHGINLGFEYAVFNRFGDSLLTSQAFNPNTNAIKYKTKLFPNDPIGDPGQLIVYFPNEKRYAFSSLGIMSYSSLVLSLLIIILFAFTIGIIYRQKRLSEIKTDFVNNMTHELKTPISTISLASQMLNDKSIPIESKNMDHISSVITDESKRLGFQVEKVLQMAIFERGKLKLKKKSLDLQDILSQVMNNFTIQLEDKKGSLEVDFEATSTTVFGDNVHLTNVVSNLVDNALKYSKDNPTLWLKTWNKGGRIYLSVRDQGIGIKKEDQKRVFEKFYRVPTGNLHNVKGFGLGLSYVKKIVEEHDGTISLKSEYERGTEFIVSFPLA